MIVNIVANNSGECNKNIFIFINKTAGEYEKMK